ncbi:hypothetical protein J4437_08305 [Candidatus Woesearchaeota archaeon]|nr:hypothetical protein [Candidatus Woesearchaeota archaeon]
MARMCPATSETPGAIQEPIYGYAIPAMHVPLSCEQACSSSEYNSALLTNIFLKIILPIIISYFLICIVFYRKNK